MDFKVIGEMGPYRLVKNKYKLVGLIDAEGNVCVPCEMDHITGSGNADKLILVLEKGPLFGFLVQGGKYIAPAYDDYLVDESGYCDIHVLGVDGYGVFMAPDYRYVSVEAKDSMLVIGDEGGFDSGAKMEEEENEDKLSLRAEKLLLEGYDYAKSVWEERYAGQETPDMKEYVEGVVAAVKKRQYGDAFNVMLEGAVRFMSDKCVAHADISKLNEKLQNHIDYHNQKGYHRLLDELMMFFKYPEPGQVRGAVLEIPAEHRVVYDARCTYGKIGRLYVAYRNNGSYQLCADVFSVMDPEQLFAENRVVRGATSPLLSELIRCVQKTKDPDKKNELLADMLERAVVFEKEDCYGHILSEGGVYAFFYEGDSDHEKYFSDEYDDELLEQGSYYYVIDGRLYEVSRMIKPYERFSEVLTARDANFIRTLQGLKEAINDEFENEI